MKALTNNKGIEFGIIGILVLYVLVLSSARLFDLFLQTVAKEEAQQVIHNAQIYSLVSHINTDQVRNHDLTVDTVQAKETFYEQIDKHITVGESSYFEDFRIENLSYITKRDGASFADGEYREYIECSADGYFTLNSYLAEDKEHHVHVESRIVLYEGMNDY